MSLLTLHLDAQSSAGYWQLLDDIKGKVSADGFAAAVEQGRARTLDEMTKTVLAELRRELAADDQSDRDLQALRDPLSEREREVAAMIAFGKSNTEIAGELVLSKRTVEKHIANILSNLDFTSRAQIVRWAIEKGLSDAES